MGHSTVPDEVLTVDTMQRDELVEALAMVKKKTTGRDLALIAVKVERDVFTVRKYMNGEVRDEGLALRILNYANGFIAINNNADFQKHQLTY